MIEITEKEIRDEMRGSPWTEGFIQVLSPEPRGLANPISRRTK
jgi:hypothetical protein